MLWNVFHFAAMCIHIHTLLLPLTYSFSLYLNKKKCEIYWVFFSLLLFCYCLLGAWFCRSHSITTTQQQHHHQTARKTYSCRDSKQSAANFIDKASNRKRLLSTLKTFNRRQRKCKTKQNKNLSINFSLIVAGWERSCCCCCIFACSAVLL